MMTGQEVTVTDTVDVMIPIVAVVSAVVLAFVAAAIISALVRSAARRSFLALDVIRRARRPMRAVLVVIAIWFALRISTEPADWRRPVLHALVIALIVAVTWLIGALAFVVEDAALHRHPTDVPDNRRARRVRTQITILRRVTVAVLVLSGIAAVLMTFPGARTAGASLFASAGVISIIAGLAAQSTLSNVFAGLQLAFTDAIRVDDVVVVEGQWGRIEEITMTYVVVHLWDDRRLIMPSTYFTVTPFENWTRRDANLLGTVELDLDWTLSVQEMRTELARLLEATELWDRRVGVLQVTEATGGLVRVRALASAADAPTLFDLRCYVREGLVDWLQREQPQALPRTRIEDDGAVRPRSSGALEGSRAERPAPSTPSSAPAPGSGTEDGDVGDVGDVADDGDPRAGDAGARAEVPPSGPVPAEAHAAPPTRRSARDRARDPGPDDTVQMTIHHDAGLFTGSIEAVERANQFAGPGRDVIAEREQGADRTGEQRVAADDDDRRPSA